MLNVLTRVKPACPIFMQLGRAKESGVALAASKL